MKKERREERVDLAGRRRRRGFLTGTLEYGEEVAELRAHREERWREGNAGGVQNSRRRMRKKTRGIRETERAPPDTCDADAPPLPPPPRRTPEASSPRRPSTSCLTPSLASSSSSLALRFLNTQSDLPREGANLDRRRVRKNFQSRAGRRLGVSRSSTREEDEEGASW